MEIKYIDRESSKTCVEKVYGDKGIKLLYNSLPGKLISPLLANRLISKLYGGSQDSAKSKEKINPFIKKFNIDIEEYLPQEGRAKDDPYGSFNQFFIRRFKDGVRPFSVDEQDFCAPCEARYYAYKSLTEQDKIPVKGKHWNSHAILGNNSWAEKFDKGPALLARLCPVDYHRFHFPVDGKIITSYAVTGAFHSVNPIALKANSKILSENERYVTIFETKEFGQVAYVEVGAMMVGKIVQTHKESNFKKGQEKGYFLFGGRTVIVFGEKGRWSPDQDILDNTKNGVETFIKLGATLGRKL